MLLEKQSTHVECNNFLQALPEYLENIDCMHQAVRDGDTSVVAQLATQSRKLTIARDRKGATPLHDAVLYGQTEVLRYIAKNYPHVLNCLDQ